MTRSVFGTFFVPGPTEVRKEVLAAMTRPMIPHRSTEFEELFARLQVGLKKLFGTQRPVFVVGSSATGFMESAIRCAPPGRLLCLVNGAFSEKFARIAEACGREVDRYEVPWGQVHRLDELEKYLTIRTYRAITVVHSETSTGALNHIRGISDISHRHGVLCLIDSVSGLGGAALRFDEWKLDYVLTGSQKSLALPPGLALAAASDEFIRLAGESKGRGVYFDLVELEKYAAKNQVPTTPSLSLLYALDVQLEAIDTEGVEARWTRHGAMAADAQAWLEHMRSTRGEGWRNIVATGCQSPTVSAIELPPDIDGATFVTAVARHGIKVGGGYGKLGGRTFRIGHMGDHTPATLKRCLDACEETASA